MKYSFETNGFYDPKLQSKFPADAVDLPQALYEALKDGLATGKKIVKDENGAPKLSVVIETQSAEALCARVDDAADAARLAVVGDPLRSAEYERAATEAQAFSAAGYQGAVPPMVAAWAINGRTPQQAADSIMAEAAKYTAALVYLRTARLNAKELIRNAIAAGEVEQAEDIAAETIASIRAAVAGIGSNA